MISGLIIYSNADQNKNTWFIEKCINSFKGKGVSLVYVEEKEVDDYLKDNSVTFAIYRGRNYRVVEFLEQKGIRCINNSLTNKTANDKWLTYKFLEKENIPIVPTFSSFEEMYDFPIVMKSVDGHGGEEVFLINRKEEIETHKKKNKRYVYQRYFPNNGDLRLYVLNKRVVGAVLRKAKNDFRSNFSLGCSQTVRVVAVCSVLVNRSDLDCRGQQVVNISTAARTSSKFLSEKNVKNIHAAPPTFCHSSPSK